MSAGRNPAPLEPPDMPEVPLEVLDQLAEESIDRPAIVVSTDEGEVTDAAIDALRRAERVFARGTVLVEIIDSTPTSKDLIRRPLGAPIIRIIPKPVLRDQLARVANFVRWRKGTDDQGREAKSLVGVHVPGFIVDAVWAKGSWPGMRPLLGIAESPVLRADGTVLTAPGYDARSGLFLATDVEIDVGEAPTREEARGAANALLEIFADFPLPDDATKATVLAALLTPFARPAIDGPVPLFLIDANVRGAGKSKIADVISILATGRPMARTSYTPNDEEMEKRVTALALEGTPLVLFDNIATGSSFGLPSLDLALTSQTVKGRILGKSEMTVPIPMNAMWMATGNNVVIAADTSRRTLRIRLESPEENPEDRSDFKHPDLLGFVRMMRSVYVAAALTVLRAYCAAGRPKVPGKSLGSFEAWSDLVRSAIVWCGLADPRVTQEVLRERSDTDAAVLVGLHDVVRRLGANAGVTAREILDAAGDDSDTREVLGNLVTGNSTNGLPTAKSLGRTLQKHCGRVHGGHALDDSSKNRSGTTLWRLVNVRGEELDS